MYAVSTALKWVAIVAAVGLAGWFGYAWYTKEPPSGADVAAVVNSVAGLVGDDAIELNRKEKLKVSIEVGKLEGYDIQLIADGFAEFPSPTVAQQVAGELILSRIFTSTPATLESRIGGDPWEVSGRLISLTMFEIDRSDAAAAPLEDMVAAFVHGSSARPKWTGAIELTIVEPVGPEKDVEP